MPAPQRRAAVLLLLLTGPLASLPVVRAHRGHLPLAYLPASPDGQRRGDAGTPAAQAELLLLANRLLHDPPNAPGGGTWPWPRTILHVSTHGWSRRMHA